MRAKTTGTLRTGVGDRSDRDLTTMLAKSRPNPARLQRRRTVMRSRRSRTSRTSRRIPVPTHTHGSQNQATRVEQRNDERRLGHCLSHRHFRYAARNAESAACCSRVCNPSLPRRLPQTAEAVPELQPVPPALDTELRREQEVRRHADLLTWPRVHLRPCRRSDFSIDVTHRTNSSWKRKWKSKRQPYRWLSWTA
eukprot:COSAG02_NODE_895_length_16129_cov_25.044604_14_plen_195_part_00